MVFRQSYAVYRREVSHPAFRLVSDLAAGQTVGRAIAAALRRREAPGAETLWAWFRQWAADGLFTAIARECAGSRTLASRPSRAESARVGRPPRQVTAGRMRRARTPRNRG